MGKFSIVRKVRTELWAHLYDPTTMGQVGVILETWLYTWGFVGAYIFAESSSATLSVMAMGLKQGVRVDNDCLI